MLKLDPSNTTLLTQKYNLLQTEITDTRTKLAALKEADKQAKQQLEAGTMGQEKYDALQREIIETEEKLKSLENTVGSGSAKLAEISAKTGEFGEKATAASQKLMPLSTAAAAVGVAGVKAASDWETAWVGVTKTVDGTEEDLARIEEGIKSLATTTGTASEDIAAVAQAAGQLGVSTDYLLEFTETMVRLGDSTDIAAEDAATAIAQLFNITGTSMDQVDNFGATLVALGNNAATSESAIMNMATRIASSGTQVGMTEQQILALATSLSSVGLEAEAGGTAISTVMTNIDKAVSTNADSMETWAQTAGMSASEFKSAWETDAYGAMQKVVKGMSDTSESGGNLNVLLDELGVTGIRTSDTMKRLSNASDLMTEMTNLSNEAWEENTALVDESDRVYETFSAELGKTKESLKQAGAAIGTQLMPYLQKAAEFVADLADKFSNMSPATQKVVAAVLAVVAIAAPLLAVIGKVSTGISAITGLLSKAKVGTFFSSILSGAGAANGGLLAMLGPIAGVVAAIAAAIAIFAALWKTNEEFRNNVTALWEQIKEIISTVIESIKAIFASFVELVSALWDAFGSDIMNVVTTVFNAIGPVINAALTVIQAIIQTITALISGDWNAVWEGIKLILSSAWELIKSIITGALNIITTVIQSAMNIISTIFSAVWNAILAVITAVINAIKTVITTAWNAISAAITTVVNTIKTVISTVWNNIMTTVSNIVNNIKNTAINAFNGLLNGIRSVLSNVTSAVSNGFQGAISFITSLPSRALQWGKDFIQGLINGITSMIGKVTSAVSNVASKITSFLHFTRPDEGPLREYETWMPDFMQGLAKGIKNSSPVVENALSKLTDSMATTFTGNMDVVAAASGIIPTVNNSIAVQVGSKQFDAYIVETMNSNTNTSRSSLSKLKGR
ncbi:MAG: phage tail tape measure protein [Lachnospiraceae bacterium]